MRDEPDAADGVARRRFRPKVVVPLAMLVVSLGLMTVGLSTDRIGLAIAGFVLLFALASFYGLTF
ncbi:DUF3040 domain-containing protein [Nocardioides sp. C4-1]|uniref:DUF3040 domain-containing protein n=1 Tax=Nocardioides sp. C4-1 TaxID=3151851 RepID=UPI0032673E8C